MSNQERFPLISGHASIDLVNTEVVRRGVRQDLLKTDSDLKTWVKTMQESGTLTAVEIGEGLSTEALQDIKVLRHFLRDGFEQVANGLQLQKDWQVHLEHFLEKAPLSFKVISEELVPFPVGNPSHALLSLAAFDALGLLATKELLTLRHCANPDCVLLFMDSSGRRKWCSMKICGNRTKVARHQSRRSKIES